MERSEIPDCFGSYDKDQAVGRDGYLRSSGTALTVQGEYGHQNRRAASALASSLVGIVPDHSGRLRRCGARIRGQDQPRLDRAIAGTRSHRNRPALAAAHPTPM